MSVDNVDDTGDEGEPLSPFDPRSGRRENFVTVQFRFPDGKVITTETFTIYADHCLTDAEFQADINFYIGPVYSKLGVYPRLVAAAGGSIPWDIIGTTCGYGAE